MPDIETLRMALIGYEEERRKIDAKIAELEDRLNGRSVAEGTAAERPKRKMSRAAKARIAAAQRKRWAQFRQQKTAKKAPAARRPAKAVARKSVSAEVRQKRIEALAKARAAKAAKKSALAKTA